jgi:hypothetical protein
MKPGILQESQEGPIAEAEFLNLIFAGELKLKTLVAHPTHTQGKWYAMEQIPPLAAKHREGVQYRETQKAQETYAKEQVRLEHQAAKEAERQIAIQQATERRANSPIAQFILDGQSETTVAKLYERVCEILTQNETIEYIAVQAKPIAIAPDCVVITNRRFIVFHQRMLGQMDFDDYLWMNLHNAQMKEGVLYGEIHFRASDGRVVSMDYLPKAQARRIYRIAQEREEAAIEVRRNRWMEEQRAGATNIMVNAPASPQPVVTPQVPITAEIVSPDDPVAKLKKLKLMLDQGLIEQAEYDAVKAKILSTL